jgi:hypothetical protein
MNTSAFASLDSESPLLDDNHFSPPLDSQEKGELDYVVYLNRYFELKSKYDEKNAKKTKKDKKQKHLVKKCIQCGQSGGTLFSQTNNRFKAICQADSPCDLHIELYRGFFVDSTRLLYDYRAILETSKENIICMQNNDIFHYNTDTLADKKKYEKEKAQYETVNQLSTDLYKCLYENDEIEKKRQEKQEAIQKVLIEIRSLIQDYKDSHHSEYIESAIQLHKNTLILLTDELRGLQYEVIEEDIHKRTLTNRYMREEEEIVEKRDSMQSVLVQREVGLKKTEINLKEPPAVVKWIFSGN